MTTDFVTADALITRACEQTGLDDFGTDNGWREGLHHLVDALGNKIYLAGAPDHMQDRLVGVLAARLEVEDWMTRHPEFGEGDIEGPLIIIGLPRTATTALLNLLANDPMWRYLRGWEGDRPVPPPDAVREANDPRALAERERVAGDTTYAGMHIQEAGGPVDDAALLRLSFRNQELGWPVFDYTRWWRDCDMQATYAYHHRMLRLLQHRRPPRRWLLKAPWHNFHLDQLAREYPEARFVMTHRDPTKIIPSAASLVMTAHATVQPLEAIDRDALGRFLFEHLRISITRVMDFRRRHGDDRFIDVYHSTFNADPLGEVARLYDALDLPFDTAAAEQLRAWAERNRKGAHGEHRYTPEEFGLTTGEINDAFADYLHEGS